LTRPFPGSLRGGHQPLPKPQEPAITATLETRRTVCGLVDGRRGPPVPHLWAQTPLSNRAPVSTHGRWTYGRSGGSAPWKPR